MFNKSTYTRKNTQKKHEMNILQQIPNSHTKWNAPHLDDVFHLHQERSFMFMISIKVVKFVAQMLSVKKREGTGGTLTFSYCKKKMKSAT